MILLARQSEIVRFQFPSVEPKFQKIQKFNLVIDKDQMWNFGGDDLEEAIMGIAYPRKKKTENKDDDENKEDLVESLRKLILGKFDDKKNEFYEWSQSIHNEVILVIDKLFLHFYY